MEIPMSTSHHFLIYQDSIPDSASLVINDEQAMFPPRAREANVLYVPPFQLTRIYQNIKAPWLLLQLSDEAFFKHLEQELECESRGALIHHRAISLGDRNAVRELFECMSANVPERQMSDSVSDLLDACLNAGTNATTDHVGGINLSTINQDDPHTKEKKIRSYMWRNVAQPICLDQLAALVFQSKYHFLRRFKSLTGHSPMNYLRMLRVFKARYLMHTQGDALKLVSIANDCGFSDQAHFTRMFKRHTGMTPSAYQKQKKSACADVLATLNNPSLSE